MKPRKPTKHLTPLERMFQHHTGSCTMHRYSDGDNRKCSCGRDEAEKQYKRLMEQVQALTLWPMTAAPSRDAEKG
jgi:hypothetical protein